jgi:hypothetical protein
MSSLLAAGIVIGGVSIAGVGAASTYYMENKKPSIKSIMRDFIIGSILVLMLVQLLPDSIQHVAGFLPSLSSVATMVGGATESLTTASAAVNEMEIQVGVPGF